MKSSWVALMLGENLVLRISQSKENKWIGTIWKNDILDVWSFSHITRFEREYSQKCINQTFSKDLSYYYLIYCFLLFYRILFDPGTAWSSFEVGKCFSCSSWSSKTSDVSRKLIKKSIYSFTYFSKHTWKNSVKMAWQKKTLVSFWHAIPSKSYPLRIFRKKNCIMTATLSSVHYNLIDVARHQYSEKDIVDQQRQQRWNS